MIIGTPCTIPLGLLTDKFLVIVCNRNACNFRQTLHRNIPKHWDTQKLENKQKPFFLGLDNAFQKV